MGSICLSSASILRCASLTKIQNIVLIIPTALEVIFSTSLVIINRDGGRRQLLLTAEGLFYLTLTLVELFSQILPAVRENLTLFRAFDLAIGVTSFLPIFFYTFFLFLFTRGELAETLPSRVRNVAKLALVLFVPAVVIFNEIASFVGVSIRNTSLGKTAESVIAIGFTGKKEEGLWTFFTSLTLALLTGFQAIVFCFAFFRLTQAILNQRRIEGKGNDAAHLIKGIGWISGALKIGAVETVVGFAGGGFEVALTRRILRFFARAFLCIGVAKGVDAVEDFRAIRSELSSAKTPTFRKSQLRLFISNPRLSTFRQLSPKATTFHANQQRPPHYRKSQTMKQLAPAGLPGMAHFADVKAVNTRQRVTVLYNDGAPTLHMRFSMLDVPSPALIVERIKSRPQSEWDAYLPKPPQAPFHQAPRSVFRDSSDSVPSLAGPFEIVTMTRRTVSQKNAMAKVYQTPSSANVPEPSFPSPNPESTPSQPPDRHKSQAISMKSIPDSLQAVRELAGQFPGPPVSFKDQMKRTDSQFIDYPTMPKVLGSPSQLAFQDRPRFQGSAANEDDATGASSSQSSILFAENRPRASKQPITYSVGTPLKSAPLYSESPIDPFNDDEEEEYKLSSRPVFAPVGKPLRQSFKAERRPSGPDSPSKSTPGTGFTGFTPFSVIQDSTPGTEDPFLDLGTALHTGKSGQFKPSQPRAPSTPIQELDPVPLRQNDDKLARTAEWIGTSATVQVAKVVAEARDKSLQNLHDRGVSIDHLAIPWLKSPEMEEAERKLARAISAKRSQPPSRFKSVGKAPRKATPAPVLPGYARGSLHLEPIIIPPRNGNMPEVILEYGSLESTATGRGVLRDSEVLGMEDNQFVKRGNFF
ncbi:hypothetical protein B0H34DRAFT_800323 [Crassisporium funariophilum]|nr:hypothetical protein B0H34DRAFT_800323 [Crassisporium funariophilum]